MARRLSLPGGDWRGMMQKVMIVVCALASFAVLVTGALSADDKAAAVKERRHLMKDVVGAAAKLVNQMVEGDVPFDAAKATKAMNDINGVPDKYVDAVPGGNRARTDRRQ
jgi:cytochrome c556